MGIPPGSYVDSCEGCHIEEEKWIVCKCKGSRGGLSSTREEVAKCSSFTNQGGTLACEKPLNEGNIPAGSYVGTCGGCRLSDDMTKVQCSHCLTDSGNYEATEAELSSCASFTNSNGRLECELSLPANEEGLPTGDYLGTCGGCRISDDAAMLQCTHCLRNDKQFTFAEADLLACRAFRNVNGQLVCDYNRVKEEV